MDSPDQPAARRPREECFVCPNCVTMFKVVSGLSEEHCPACKAPAHLIPVARPWNTTDGWLSRYREMVHTRQTDLIPRAANWFRRRRGRASLLALPIKAPVEQICEEKPGSLVERFLIQTIDLAQAVRLFANDAARRGPPFWDGEVVILPKKPLDPPSTRYQDSTHYLLRRVGEDRFEIYYNYSSYHDDSR